MRKRRHHTPLPARLSLLLAAACYIAVATLGPWRHLAIEMASAGAPAAPAVHAPGTQDAPQHPTHAPAHDERTCLLCHSLSATAMPAAGTVVPLLVAPARTVAAEAASDAQSGARHLTRARAPPAAFV